jgi:hypothetical protein
MERKMSRNCCVGGGGASAGGHEPSESVSAPHGCGPPDSPTAEPNPRPPNRLRLVRRGLAACGSSALLILMPKCPACVAAYVSLATGVGVSITTAAYLRWTVIGLCAAVVAFICIRAAFDIFGGAGRWSWIGANAKR